MCTGRDCAKCNIRSCHLPFDRYKTFWSWQATESECRNLCGTDGIVVLTVTVLATVALRCLACALQALGVECLDDSRRLPHILTFTRPNMNNLKIQKKKITPKKQLLMKTRRERFTQVELRTSERARTLQRFCQRTLYDAKQTKRNNATREKAQAERINRMRRKRIVRAERRDEANKKAKKASDDFFYATRVKQSPDQNDQGVPKKDLEGQPLGRKGE